MIPVIPRLIILSRKEEYEQRQSMSEAPRKCRNLKRVIAVRTSGKHVYVFRRVASFRKLSAHVRSQLTHSYVYHHFAFQNNNVLFGL